MFCDVTLNFFRLRLQYLRGENRLDVKSLPRFCYDEDPNPDATGGQGFLFSGLLRRVRSLIHSYREHFLKTFQAAVHILLGPSAVDISPLSLGLQSKHRKGTKKSNADTLEIKHMSPALLAYIATIVRHCYFSITPNDPWWTGFLLSH
jgi:hypothetical protein